ncbi:3'-5' exonuclease [Winogradskyella alexanderae]|uniref:3'-5' exonuclease n=1 Tax=Winogradskyella alexanderae TaxID=2877123 RepID=A0ABS7XUL4_9FLAO|nr:3'-5' exonuclease [Winogradskyella alexanderae]MCA0133470.1 3'-5' exonuclease [Winogradskyella alexanderae]
MKWFKSKSYPTYWENYLAQFKQTQSENLHDLRFVVFDTETTGLNTKKDRILSIGCIAIQNLKIKVADQLECYLIQENFNPDTVKIHGLLKEGSLKKLNEEEAILEFINYIGNSIIVAHHASFDIAMINSSLKRMDLPKLRNKVLDTNHLFRKMKINQNKEHFSLDEIANYFSIPLHDRHTASGDAYITALILLKIIAYLNKEKQYNLNDLLRSDQRIGLI